MKSYNFTIDINSTGLGCVHAVSKEEAIRKIELGEWDDIYNEVDAEYGDFEITDVSEE